MKLRLLILSLLILGCQSAKEERSTEIEQPKEEVVAPSEIEIRTVPGQSPLKEDEERTDWQNPNLVLDVLGNLEGKTIADIGAGSGYFTFKMAKNAEKVIALDIDPNALEYIQSQKRIVGDWANNIEARLTPPDVPNLLPQEVDAALLVNTYHFLPNQQKYLPRLLEGIKPGGLFVLVDFKLGEIPVGPSDQFKGKPEDVRRDLRRAGFRSIDIDTKSLEFQYIITAKKK
ncbi:class I SAM-dependent methyltransferase [Roseivirga pacifica]